MDLWRRIESLLARFGDDEADRQQLRTLGEQLPYSIQALPRDDRPRAQALGVEVLYRLGEPQRAIFWSQPVLGPATSLWVGRALFDLGRRDQAVRHFRHALEMPSLESSVRGELEELVARQ